MTNPGIGWRKRIDRARFWDRIIGLWLLVVLIGLPLAAWIQHITYTAGAAQWAALVAGAVVFPLGILHGIAIWLGIGL